MKNETYILTAKTVEEAMANARSQYGSADNELSFEILEMPQKGFLGFGAKPAKVKVTVSKALEEVHLSDLVSELKSMKISDAPAEEKPRKTEKPQQNQQKQNNGNNQPKQKPQQNQSKQQNQQKPNGNNQQQKPKQEQKPNQGKPAAQKAAPAEVKKPKSEIKETVREIKSEIKEEIREVKEEIKETVREVKEEIREEVKEFKSESDLPAALRTPVKKNQPQQKKPQKKTAPKPQSNKSGDEKKKDLLSAVMGVADAPKKESPAVTVTPTVMKPKAEPAPAPEKESAPKAAAVPGERVERTVAEAVDAALAAFAAFEPAPLPEGAEETTENKEIPVEFVTPEKLQLALNFVNTLLKNMHLEAEAVPATTGAQAPEDAAEGVVEARVEITGRDTGLLIGHHGETLDAIQTLMNLAANRRDSEGRRDYVKIVLDMADYRRKREETLRTLARRTAARVVKYKRNIVLEPMNPYERRVIHSELHSVENVSTHSVGSDENRKIVITYEGADKVVRPRKNDRHRRSDKQDTAAGEKKPPRERAPRGDRPAKPARAKSIDEVQIDLSSDSSKTFGSISADEGFESGKDPIEEIAKAAEANEENLREY